MNLDTHGSSRFITAAISFSVAVLLSACGGGGGSAPAPETQTVTCPNGTSKTAATLDAANALCAAPALVSVSPTNASAAVPVDTFVSVDVVTDSTLDATSVTATNVTLKAGTNPIAGAASVVGTKSFKFVPTAKLNYAQAYAFSATVKDTLGKTLTVSTTFTTAAVSCTSPQVPATDGQSCVDPIVVCMAPAVRYAAMNTCVVPINVQMSIPPLVLPSAKIKVTDPAFFAAIVRGDVLLMDTGMKMVSSPDVSKRTRDLVFGVYRWQSPIEPGTVNDGSIKTIIKMLFKDDLRGVFGYDGLQEGAFVLVEDPTKPLPEDRFIGTVDGFLFRGQPGNVCYMTVYSGSPAGDSFGVASSTACPVWN